MSQRLCGATCGCDHGTGHQRVECYCIALAGHQGARYWESCQQPNPYLKDCPKSPMPSKTHEWCFDMMCAFCGCNMPTQQAREHIDRVLKRVDRLGPW
jgi:hypothetical protein